MAITSRCFTFQRTSRLKLRALYARLKHVVHAKCSSYHILPAHIPTALDEQLLEKALRGGRDLAMQTLAVLAIKGQGEIEREGG